MKCLVLFSLINIASIAYAGIGNGKNYLEKTLIEDIENPCDIETELDFGQLELLESQDDHLYIQIEACDDHLQYYDVTVNDGKLHIQEFTIDTDGMEIITDSHPFFESKHAKNFHVSGGFLIGRTVILNGYKVFGNNHYWTPSLVRIYLPKKCKEEESKNIAQKLDILVNEINDYLWREIGPNFLPRKFSKKKLLDSFIDGDLKAFILQDIEPLLEHLSKGDNIEVISSEIILHTNKRYDAAHEQLKDECISFQGMPSSFFLKTDKHVIIDIIKKALQSNVHTVN